MVTFLSCNQVFVTLLSCIFLKEACGLFEIINLVLVLGGITLVIQVSRSFLHF